MEIMLVEITLRALCALLVYRVSWTTTHRLAAPVVSACATRMQKSWKGFAWWLAYALLTLATAVVSLVVAYRAWNWAFLQRLLSELIQSIIL